MKAVFGAGLLALLLVGCATRPPPSGTARVIDPHVPDFANKPFEPFSREAAVAIALREWRLFGQPVDDNPPDTTRPPPLPQDKPERQSGLWQRVGEYWWESQPPDSADAAWTGKHDAYGREFPASEDGDYAWSAAFISYVMRIAGATDRFLYAPDHAAYINAGAAPGGWGVIRDQRPGVYPPKLGDLICMGRGHAAGMSFDALPAPVFPGHCDIVVGIAPGVLSVIGGNVDDAVTLKHVPTSQDGTIATPDGVSLDSRYPWFVVLEILYDR